ncbi:MAG: serine/threonine-protein kinase [Kofleriaceae bacterium]
MSLLSGKYRVDQRLGGGGMAEVFLGSMVGAEGFSRKVAIKRVLPGFSDNPAFAQMFIGEAQISAQLQHPNIVSVLDFDRDSENRLFLVMELVEGRDLDSLVSTGVLPIPLVIFVISEVLRGLGHAHDLPTTSSQLRGIVHRDVSPHNVLLSWEGAVKVSDFGIAKAREASQATASVLIKGKPAYMSPEQANGEQLDGRSDLFAVGVMLWEMLVGRRLFVGEDTRTTLAAVLFGQIPRPRSLRSDIPKDVERVVMKLLERDVPARYPTAEAAIADLLECADAPKAGRELLQKTLQERFPDMAPVRGSALRSRQASLQQQPISGSGNTPVGMYTPPIASGTMGDGRANAAVSMSGSSSMQSIGVQRSGPTATVDLGRRRGGRMLILIAAGVASSVIAFAIAMVVMKKPAPVGTGSGTNVVPVATLDAQSVAQATGSDAGMVDAAPPDAPIVVQSPTVDAGVPNVAVNEGKKDAPSSQKGHPANDVKGPKGQGTLSVTKADAPMLTVWVDGKKIGDTPQVITLSAGKHKVRLEGPNAPENLTVTIDPTKPQPQKVER